MTFFSVANSESEYPINFTQGECASIKTMFFLGPENADKKPGMGNEHNK